MYLTVRAARFSEFDQLLPLIRDRFVYTPQQQQQLLEIWTAVLREGSGESAVVEDHNRPPHERVVGFGLSVFVADWFADQAASMPPYIGPRFLELYGQGRSPILTRKEVAHANAHQGLNVFFLHVGWPEDRLTALEVKHIRHFLADAFVVLHRGYKLRSTFHEFHGKEELAMLLAMGGRLWSDYGWFFRDHPDLAPPEEHWPYLGGTRREEALRQEGTVAFALFSSPSPRYFFTPREQEVLRMALLGSTDEAIAQELGVKLVTVKKLWESIYERVKAKDPGIFPSHLSEASDGIRRYKQRRRFLLDHLRSHPEEIRPRPTKKHRPRVVDGG